jgi:hypothetical protein
MNHTELSGFAEHAVTDPLIVTATGVLNFFQGPVLVLFFTNMRTSDLVKSFILPMK